jgi:hypothetical protein
MAVVFLEGRLSPIPMRMASTKFHRGPHRGVCQFALSNAKTHKSAKRNSLRDLAFRTTRLKYHWKNGYQRITMATVKTNKLGSL